ncbi:MAG: NAD(P)-dependent oxidoreductase [Ilumatobacteraceae bacterium]
MTRHVLVLGAGGFIGRAVSCALLDAPQTSVLTAHFRQPPPRRMLSQTGSGWHALDLAQASVADVGAMIDKLVPDVIVNCVGVTSGSTPQMRVANIDVVRTLTAALEMRPGIHLIHLGSAAEYGSCVRGRPIGVNAVASPVSDYGLTKLAGTLHIVAAAETGHLVATVLRVFNPLGRESNAASLAGRAAREIDAAMRRGDDVVRLGNLGTWRDYVDVRDVASAVMAAVSTPPRRSTVLNVGRGEAVLSRDLVTSLASVAGYGGTIVESDPGSVRSAAVSWQCADISTTKDQIGWLPQWLTEDSLRYVWSGIRHGVHT